MFKDRTDAGEQLAEKLKEYAENKDVIVLGIPRGGVVVASVVSKALHLPLDVIIIKKIGFPGQEEFAIGATGPEISHIDQNKIKEYRIDEKTLETELAQKQKEAKERYDFLSKGRTPESLKNKIVIIIDDGIATGETMKLAVQIIKKHSPKKIIVAIPVASEQSLDELEADEIVSVLKPKDLSAIGQFYSDFSQVEDSEVKEILQNGRN